MKRKYLGVILPFIALGALLSTPLLQGKTTPLLIVRLIGTIAGTATLLRKTDDELSWLQEEQRRLDAQRDELSKRYIADTEILEGWVQDESARLAREANDRIKDIEGQAEMLVGQAMAEAELWQSKYLDTLQQLESYLLPRKPKGVSRVETVASRIIEYYYGQGIILDYEDSWTENEYDLIRVKPRSGGKEPLQKLGDEVQLELRLSSLPTFSIVQGCVQIRLETVAIDTRVATVKPKVIEPNNGYLARILATCASFRLNGETGSGKSTFTRYLISLMEGDKVLIDPKYPMSEWDIVPKYKGIDEAFQGLQEAADEVENRLALARQDKEVGKPIRNFKPITYILDEIDWTVTHYGQEAANTLRVTLKVGRALGVRILYIGQTPLASRLKMNRDDFRHSASFFLGENIPAAIEEVCTSATLKADLIAQYNLRLEQGLRFSMLVKFPGSQPFLASLPSPTEQSASHPLQPSETVVTSLQPETELDGTRSYSTEMDVTNSVTTDNDGLQPNMDDPRVKQAMDALGRGLSKSDIIKNIWHFGGRQYGQGILLWKTLNLPASNG